MIRSVVVGMNADITEYRVIYGSNQNTEQKHKQKHKQTKKQKEKKKQNKTGSRRVFTFPVLACLYLVGHFWVPNVHYSVVSGLPWSSADRQ